MTKGACDAFGMADERPVALIVLPGALGALEGADWGARLGGGGRRVLIVPYGGGDRLDALVARVAALADAEGAGRFDLLGQSYGGWIAQCVARAHPKRVRRLVLSHSFALEPRHAWRFRLGRRMLKLLPRAPAAALLTKRAARALAPVAAKDAALHARLLAALAARVREPDFWDGLAAQQRCLQQSLEPPFSALPPAAAALPVLIVEGGNDPLLGARDRAALRARFPQAQLLRFASAGHVSSLAEPEAFAAAVGAFLAAPDPGAAAPRA